MTITWSGYKGNGTELGYEYIKISGVTTNNLVMKAYGYEAGHTTVLYSWGKDYPSLAKKQINKLYYTTLLHKSRVGDFLLLSACDGTEDEPINCSSGVIEHITGGIVSGIGYGFLQHAAMIYKKNDTSFTVMQARSPSHGVGTDPFTIDK